MKMVAWVCAASLVAGCAVQSAGSDEPRTTCPDGGEATDVGERTLCLYQGPITETGFECPPELPFQYSGDGWLMCAEEAGIPQKEVDAAAAQAQAGADSDDLPAEEPDEPDEVPAASDSCEVDYDQDGICAEDDADDRDPAVGAAPSPPDPEPEDDPPVSACEDLDDDGSCAPTDPDDADPAIYDLGIHEGPDGSAWLVVCLDEGGATQCVGVDPAGGGMPPESWIESWEEICEADSGLCWTVPVLCTDDDGDPGPCSEECPPAGHGEDPCAE